MSSADKLKSQVAEINEKYLVGLCANYADKPCFHHRQTDNHFILLSKKISVGCSNSKSQFMGSAPYYY